MAQSLSALQRESVIIPFRRVEIKRRTGAGYESNWYDVSSLATSWPTINFEIDRKPFIFNIASADMSFRNDEKQFSSEANAGSIFAGKLTRYRTLCRISTGLEDSSGNQYPSDTSDQISFYGLFSDMIDDGFLETRVSINSVMQVFQELPASLLAPSLTNLSLTSLQIMQTVRDLADSNAVSVIGPFISTTAFLLTTTGRTYNFGTTTMFDGLSIFDFISKLAIAEDYCFFISKSGQLIFTDRTTTASSLYTFNGAGEKDVNIESVDYFGEAVSSIITKVSAVIFNSQVVTAIEGANVGDNSSTWKYGAREFKFDAEFISTTAAASTVVGAILSEHSPIKNELQITTKYIAPNLELKDRVTVNFKGEPGGDGSQWDYFNWDYGLWSDERGGIFLDAEQFKILGITIDMENFRTRYYLREI